eukprot:337892_1
MVSHSEFMVVAFTNNNQWFTDEHEAIYSYHANQQIWIEADISYVFEPHCSAMDKKNNILYIYDASQSLTKINMNTTQIDGYENAIDVGEHSRCFCVENKLHLIAGAKNKYHYVWNDTDKKFEKLNVFSEHKTGLVSPEIIYVEPRDVFYLFGGQWDGSFNPRDTIYCYHSRKDKWETLDTKMAIPLTGFGIVCTTDGRYVLLFGGYTTDYQMSDQIWIYDLDEDIFILSPIRLPIAGIFKAAITDNHSYSMLLTFGYIRS